MFGVRKFYGLVRKCQVNKRQVPSRERHLVMIQGD